MNVTSGRQYSPAPFEVWAILDFWLRRWVWLACWTIGLAAAGALIAHLVWGRTYTASAQLIHYEPTTVDDAFRPRAISTPSLVVMLQSAGLFEEIGAKMSPKMSAKELSRHLEITLDRNNDVATVSATGNSRQEATDIVNRFCSAAIAYTQNMQKQEAAEASTTVRQQLAQVEKEIASERAKVPDESTAKVNAIVGDAADELPALPPSDLPQRIQTAKEQLDELLVRYTDAHPLVRDQRARIAAMEAAQKRYDAAAATRAKRDPAAARAIAAAQAPAAMWGRITPEEVAMGERLRSLETNRALLIARQRAIQPFQDQPPGYFSVLMSAEANPTLEHRHRLEMALCACLGAFFGLVGSAGQILFSEFMDNRIKTRADVRRVTGLPLIATLGDLRRMTPVARDQWAFRAWTALQSRLSLSPNHGMICGITSAHLGDGRSTWVELLARAASNCGFRVLTITAQPNEQMASQLARSGKKPTLKSAPPAPSLPAGAPNAPVPQANGGNVALTQSVLTTPGTIVDRLTGTDSPPMVNIPLPGWVWNLDRRKQWQSALEAWRAIEHVVIFVELPPASAPETVLLAENVPNLVWLVDAENTDASETHLELETLRDARCNLVGAVLNRERSTPIRGRFSRWLGSSAFLLVAGLMLAAPKHLLAQDDKQPLPENPPGGVVATASDNGTTATTTTTTFSIVDPQQRNGWQKKLTLGPGDILSFHLFGAPELSREEVPIGPDGRVSYLEAENIMAAGLTVDELRDRLNDELGKFRRSPQAYVVPVAYHSKKYYMLGTVVQKGVYSLDRPITVIEAVARARGFETGLQRGNIVETTDFSRSFVSRDGKRLPVDFERLFMHGDLTQNIAIEPNDYLYFPAGAAGEIYVLGEVKGPGAVQYDPDTNALSAIAARGGFTDRAWKTRVLVVRGSLNHPETFVVDVAGALVGETPNLALKPGDIVYVNHRPWARAQELLDRAASAFVESAVITWTSVHVSAKGAGASIVVP